MNFHVLSEFGLLCRIINNEIVLFQFRTVSSPHLFSLVANCVDLLNLTVGSWCSLVLCSYSVVMYLFQANETLVTKTTVTVPVNGGPVEAVSTIETVPYWTRSRRRTGEISVTACILGCLSYTTNLIIVCWNYLNSTKSDLETSLCPLKVKATWYVLRHSARTDQCGLILDIFMQWWLCSSGYYLEKCSHYFLWMAWVWIGSSNDSAVCGGWSWCLTQIFICSFSYSAAMEWDSESVKSEDVFKQPANPEGEKIAEPSTPQGTGGVRLHDFASKTVRMSLVWENYILTRKDFQIIFFIHNIFNIVSTVKYLHQY